MEEIAAALETAGLEYVSAQFLLRRNVDQGMGAHGFCSVDTGWGTSRLTTSWVWIIVYTRTCCSGTCNTTGITTSFWDVSRGCWYGSIRDTLAACAASPFDHRGTQSSGTDCLTSFIGYYPSYCGGNASASRGYLQRPSAFSSR